MNIHLQFNSTTIQNKILIGKKRGIPHARRILEKKVPFVVICHYRMKFKFREMV